MATNNSFTKRPGTTDYGKDYEDVIVTNLSIKYATDDSIERFYLSSNHSSFGDFDDVVLELTKDNGDEENYALQLKHVTSSDKGSLKNKLSGAKGKFSIEQYFLNFNTVQGRNSFNFVLYTNQKCNMKEGEVLTLDNKMEIKILTIKQTMFNFTQPSGKCYQFQVEQCDDTTVDIEQWRQFFEKFFLYTNQANVSEVTTETIKMFCNIFQCNKEIAEQYLSFITNWSKPECKKEKLNKEFLKEVIEKHLVTPFMKPFVFAETKNNDQLKLFKSLLYNFRITFIGEDSLNDIRTIWDNGNDLSDVDKLNKLANKFQLINDDDENTKTLLLWLSKKYPLIVQANKTTIKAISLQTDKRYILIGHPDFGEEERRILNIWYKLTDLDQQSDIYRTILSSFKCLLKNSEISLETLLEKNSKIRNVITTKELLQMAKGTFKMAHVVQILALSDTEINQKCQEGYTPLHVACMKGYNELVELIAMSDIDINGASKDGDSPLFLAVFHGHPTVVKQLLACEADVDAANKDGYRPFQIACSKADIELVQILADAKANIDAADKDGIAPIQVVASHGNVNILEILIRYGVNVNKCNQNGESALYLASQNGHAAVVDLLIKNKAKNISNLSGNTPLHVASKKGHAEVVSLLAEHGQSQQNEDSEDQDYDEEEGLKDVFYLNACNVKGDTPLHLACAFGHFEVVKVLLKYRANVEIRNWKGLSARDLAQKKNYVQIVELFKNY